MNCLITGSEGFIGSYVCNELLAAGYHVIGIDDYSKYGRVQRSHQSHPNFKFINAEIGGRYWNFKSGNIGPVDYIVHLAAKIGGIKYFHKYAYDIIVQNAYIDKCICDLAIKLKPQKLIYFSSSMVFESCIPPYHEDDIIGVPSPHSTYGFSKLAGEYICSGLKTQYGIDYNIIRPFNAIGIGEDTAKNENPGDLDEFGISLSHVIPDFIYKALKQMNPFPIYGDGNQVRVFTNCRDIARATRLVLEKGKENRDFNISGNKPITMLDLARRIWRKINQDEEFVPVFLEPFVHDVQKRVTETSTAEEELGFKAEISLDESLDEIIEYMRNKVKCSQS